MEATLEFFTTEEQAITKCKEYNEDLPADDDDVYCVMQSEVDFGTGTWAVQLQSEAEDAGFEEAEDSLEGYTIYR